MSRDRNRLRDTFLVACIIYSKIRIDKIIPRAVYLNYKLYFAHLPRDAQASC